MPPHWYAVHVLAEELVRVGEMRGPTAVARIDAAILADEAWTVGRRVRIGDAVRAGVQSSSK